MLVSSLLAEKPEYPEESIRKYLKLGLQLQVLFNRKRVTDDGEGVVSDYQSDADRT